MDLNDFIFRDDTALALGADLDGDAAAEAKSGSFMLLKASVAAAVASAVLGLSHFLGLATKGL